MTIYGRYKRRTAVFAVSVLLIAAIAALGLVTTSSPARVLFAAGILGAVRLERRSDWAALLKRAIESTPVGLCIFDADSRLIISNAQFANMYGLAPAGVERDTTRQEILASWSALLSPSERGVGSIGGSTGRTDPRDVVQATHELRDGRIISVSQHPMAGGGLVEVHKDITTERLAEARANRAMQALIEKQYAIDQAVIVAITDVKGTITYVNDNFCGISGYSREELIGQNHRILKSGAHPKELFRDMHRCLAKGQVWRGELCNRSKSGKLYWVDTIITPQLGSEGKPVSYMAIRIDITARKEAEAQVALAATHDSLTGLLNRSTLLDRGRAELHSEEHSNRLSLHLLDLDGFKGVNDTLGHNAGDKLLKQVASRLRSLTADEDLVGRLGGDEFAIIRRAAGPAGGPSLRLGRRIVEAMAAPFELDNHQFHISASVGIALCPEHGCNPEDLLKKADLALYAVKATGRNGCSLYQPAMLEAFEDEKAIEARLRRALARNEFELHYQPVLDVKSRSIRAAEALVRWRNPTEGLIPPAQFIPVAERTGLILPLSEWIIMQACQDAVSWPSDIQLAVNISAIQFKRGNLFEVVMQALLRSGLSPGRLEIEVTETALLEHQSEQLQTFRKLKNIGVTVVLDDFGTGYSSVSYVTNFPFDRIKIDKSFVQGMDKRECAAVIASAIALAKGLGISITAEGIETESQLRVMRSVGIDFVQGYLFSPPLPRDEFISKLGEQDQRDDRSPASREERLAI